MYSLNKLLNDHITNNQDSAVFPEQRGNWNSKDQKSKCAQWTQEPSLTATQTVIPQIIKGCSHFLDKEGATHKECHLPILSTFALPLHWGNAMTPVFNHGLSFCHKFHKRPSIITDKFITGLVSGDGRPKSPGLPVQRPWVPLFIQTDDKIASVCCSIWKLTMYHNHPKSYDFIRLQVLRNCGLESPLIHWRRLCYGSLLAQLQLRLHCVRWEMMASVWICHIPPRMLPEKRYTPFGYL